MSKPFVPKAGTTAECAAFTGLENEVVLDEEKGSLIIHDGITAGGAAEIFPKAKNDELYEAKGTCLPLSGGKMLGAIRFDNGNAIYQSKDSNGINIFGGTGANNGAYIQIFGKDSSGNQGVFNFVATDGTDSSVLRGTPSDALTWNGKAIITSAGGTLASGLKFSSGSIYNMNLTVNNGRMVICGSENTTSGAFIRLSGKDETNYAGDWRLTAHNGTESKTLVGKPNGPLTWGGNEVERVISSGTNYKRYASGMQICWGRNSTGSNGGANIVFPVPFTDQPELLPVIHGLSASGGPWSILYQPVSGTEGNVWAFSPSGGHAQVGVSWIAIGRWE